MSEPITWRSVSAPNFGASAALLNSGGETLNQGITSLAAVAKGYADEQKGIAVSNAVADLSNATNDADLGSAFAAHSANLKDHGIDLKDLIAARQAQHKTLQGDATFKSDQELAASDLAGNVLKQAGFDIENKTAQGALDYQATEQEQKTGTYKQGILESNSDIEANRSGNALRLLQAGEIGAARKLLAEERVATNTGMAAYLKASQNEKNFTNGVPDRGKIIADLDSQGVTPDIMLKGFAAEKTFGGAEAIAEAAKTEKANKATRDLASFNDTLKNNSANRTAAIDAIGLNVDKDVTLFGGLFGEDSQYNEAMANIKSAAATTYVDASGNTKTVPPNVLNDLVKSSSDSAGDLLPNRFNDKFKALISQLAKEK